MRKHNVGIISIDRDRSGITDASDPVGCGWRIFFRLRPRPQREWDTYFEKIRLEHELAGKLIYKHRIIRESRAGDYHYGSNRRRFGYALRRLFGRRLAYGVEVLCPATNEDLQRATAELTRLVAKTNSAYSQATSAHSQSDVAARVATDRLGTAVKSIEAQLKKGAALDHPEGVSAKQSARR